MSSNITSYVDLAQILLYVFWIFFFGLILHLRTEDKREGYPMAPDPANPSEKNKRHMVGYPDIPKPKEFRMPDGSVRYAPHPEREPELHAKPVNKWPGAPLAPTVDPMGAGVGPGSYALREDKAEMNLDGKPRIVPLRNDPEWYVAKEDPDPRGFAVVGCDGKQAGKVVDMWVDRAEPKILYFEVELPGSGEMTGKRVMLPFNFSRIDAYYKRIMVKSIKSSQFANVPGMSNPDQITNLEEEKILGYYGGGHLYATPDRQEPWV